MWCSILLRRGHSDGGTEEPGERLMEIHLANKLGSQSYARYKGAIHKLELEGLVTMITEEGASGSDAGEEHERCAGGPQGHGCALRGAGV